MDFLTEIIIGFIFVVVVSISIFKEDGYSLTESISNAFGQGCLIMLGSLLFIGFFTILILVFFH